MGMEPFKCKANCPVCGRGLFRGAPNSVVEGKCPKCGTYLKVQFTNNGFQVTTIDALMKDSGQPMSE